MELPFGLRALKGVNVSRIVNGRSLLDCCTADRQWRPFISDIDTLFLDNMARMLNERISVRQKREQTQKDKLEAWKKEEKMNRRFQREQQKLAAEVARMKLEKLYEQKLKAQRQHLYDSLNTTEPTQVKTHHHFVNVHMSFCHNRFSFAVNKIVR